MDAGTLRPASPPRRASVSGAPKKEASAGGSAGTSAAAREPETYRQDVIPWSNADPTRRVRSALHPRTIPRPTHLAPRRPTNRMCRMRRDRWKTRNAPRTRAPRRPTHLSPLSSPPFFFFENVAPQAPAAPAPLRKLATTGLIDVYKRINRNYYETRSWRSSRGGSAAGSADGAGRGRELPKPAVPARRAASARRMPRLGARRRSAVLGAARTRSARARGAGWVPTHPFRVVRHGGFPAGRVMAGLRRIGTRRRRASTAPRHLLHDVYAVGRVIGRGAFARVVVAYDIVTDARVAIKIIRNASRSFHARARKEIEILRVLGGGGGGGGARGARSAARAERTRGATPTLSSCSTTSRFAEATTRQGCSVLRSQHTRMTTPTRLPPPQRRRDGVIRPRTRMGFGVWCLSSCRTLCTTCFAPRRSEAYRWRSCASSRSRSCTRCGTSSRTGWCT